MAMMSHRTGHPRTIKALQVKVILELLSLNLILTLMTNKIKMKISKTKLILIRMKKREDEKCLAASTAVVKAH